MENIILKSEEVLAVFSPEHGMNLMQLQVEKKELIAQSTKPLFEERFAGLGSLIGPHFHHRPKEKIMKVPSEELFPHIARVKAKGILEPFSHGIARYAPWKAQVSQNSVTATLRSSDLWNGVSLAQLEGFSFQMNLVASLLTRGIFLDYSVDSETSSVIRWKPVPDTFLGGDGGLYFDVTQEVDYGFIPRKGAEGLFEIFYENELFTLKISFKTGGEEVSWQLFRPKGGDYICIEPLSARNPRDPISKKSRLQVNIEVL